MQPIFEKVTIIGVGLIGGSLGMALINRGLAVMVTGVDETENLELAIEVEAIHEGTIDIAAAVADADLVVVATPVGVTNDIIKNVAPIVKQGCIITDVGSTKSGIVYEAEGIISPGTFFVGGHPMTGSEVSGVKGADRYLFENAVYVLTPTQNTDNNALAKVSQMAAAIGARVIEIDPGEHDLMVATVSHLPHIVATALVNTAGNLDIEHQGLLMLAAGGFRDTTRVASGNPLMWRDICITNRDNILKVLDKFSEVLNETREMVAACDQSALENSFRKAGETRRNIPSRIRGYLPLMYEITVTVPDRPGAITVLTACLGNAGININDIEILRVREGEGGTIRLAFGSQSDQERAIDLLRSEGVPAKKRGVFF
ncbi:prephenate dehydrogenase/arogenate dehydrogenase family protein [Phosphitispora sp. TUW77]|uniref:prephenate dehydrogenase/arogenate dehydrogenase family protein n=1 Tax=Phosphitispora sp. TUW77 TaxID=3152361 RepID=UPI003AB6362A